MNQTLEVQFVDAGGVRVAYDERGPRRGPALLCLPGWGVSRSFFEPLAEHLERSRRVVTLDWRGHGESGRPAEDFGHAELVADALAVIEASGATDVVPVAQAHGAWVALELRRRLGRRVRGIVATSWLLLDPPPPFTGVLRALQDPEQWRGARDQLLGMWLAGAPPALSGRVRDDMGAYGFDTWARGGREIAAEYARHGSPLRALSTMTPPPAFLHLFSQPRAEGFLAAQQSFSRDNGWFSVQRLDAVSHFPPLEAPGATAAAIEAFVGALE
jgi:pimeloyl-ACP methyl ester carboxylesterase